MWFSTVVTDQWNRVPFSFWDRWWVSTVSGLRVMPQSDFQECKDNDSVYRYLHDVKSQKESRRTCTADLERRPINSHFSRQRKLIYSTSCLDILRLDFFYSANLFTRSRSIYDAEKISAQQESFIIDENRFFNFFCKSKTERNCVNYSGPVLPRYAWRNSRGRSSAAPWRIE